VGIILVNNVSHSGNKNLSCEVLGCRFYMKKLRLRWSLTLVNLKMHVNIPADVTFDRLIYTSKNI